MLLQFLEFVADFWKVKDGPRWQWSGSGARLVEWLVDAPSWHLGVVLDERMRITACCELASIGFVGDRGEEGLICTR